MHLRYGSYNHAAGECIVSISRVERANESGLSYGYTETWTIDGMLVGSSQADLTTKIQALEAAYASGGFDLTLVDDLGNDTPHKMVSANAIEGVKVVKPSYPMGEGAEYTTFRHYTIVATADFDVIESGGLISWGETLTFSGGGAQYVWQQPLSGPPIKQQVATATPYRLIQSGSATGRSGYPTPAPYVLPAGDLIEMPTISKTGPGAGNYNFVISWTYVFERVAAISTALNPAVG